MNKKVFSNIVILGILVVIVIGLVGCFPVGKQTSTLQKISDYQKLDFFETLIQYYKIKDPEEKRQVAKILEAKTDASIEANNKGEIIVAFDLIPRTKDPLFYDYLVSLLSRFKNDPATVRDIIAKLATLGDKRAIPIIIEYTNESDIYSSVNSDAARMQLGDDSVLNSLLEYSRSEGIIKVTAIVGLRYSHSQDATNRLKEIIANNEAWASDAYRVLENQKILAMPLKQKKEYLLSLRNAPREDIQRLAFYLLTELPYDKTLEEVLIPTIEQDFQRVASPGGRVYIGKELRLRQQNFLRSFIYSDNLRPWVEEKLLKLKQLPDDQPLQT